MTALRALVRRNTKLFFRDRGMFFTSLITPLILLVLYASFLGNVFRDTFVSAAAEAGFTLSDDLLGGCVGGQLFSSLLAVSCVTVSFCSNMLMVQDKVSGARRDLTVSPVRSSALALGYYLSTLIASLIICLVTLAVCFGYLAFAGWYLSVGDILCILLDVFLLVMFGTALSSVINFFLSTQGQISAVGTVISAGYGFLCGAYMPISSFSPALQKALSFLPGTYGTVLLRSHVMRGAFAEMTAQGLPAAFTDALQDAIDCRLYFFGSRVGTAALYLVLGGAVAVLLAVYVLLNRLQKNRPA